MKNRSVNILIVALCLLIVLSVTLAIFIEKARQDFEGDLRVSANGVTEKIFVVRELSLNPTESRDYTVNLLCAASGVYNLTLDYNETRDGGMKDHVVVTMTLGDELIYAGTLANLLQDGVSVQTVCTLEEKDSIPLKVHYEMPHHIGNEAQGTSADFKISLAIKKA